MFTERLPTSIYIVNQHFYMCMCAYLIYFGTETGVDDSTDSSGNQTFNEDILWRSNKGLLCTLHVCLSTVHVHSTIHLVDT